MEIAAITALIGLGYMLTKQQKAKTDEGFESNEQIFPNGGQPAPIYEQERTPPGVATIPGKPRQPYRVPGGGLDQFYQLPSGGSLPANPITQPDLYPPNVAFSTQGPAQRSLLVNTVRMNTPGEEAPPTYNDGKTFTSPLTGLPMSATEFTHNNMVPFFRGSVKQNVRDNANTAALDNMVGAGRTQIEKREQAPLFDPVREPTGNVTGLESVTDFFQDRMVVSTNRANEVPVEQIRVGPGVGQGFSSLPIGGFQQMEVLEVARRGLSVDELRVASNPKITYEGMVIPGTAIGTQRGDIGEVRKYRPDTFFLNEHGERNFVAGNAENLKPVVRSDVVMKFQTRQETSEEFQGPAVMAESKATYNVPSFRAPFARQQDGYGFRNADGSNYGTPNTDAPNNDFGAKAYDLPVNQRNMTAERGQALNLVTAGSPQAMTVYDPNDVARTTVRETTGANDWIGGAVGVEATKLTVYDPSDIMRPTIRNTNAEIDTALNVTRAGTGAMPQLAFPDGMRATTKEQVSANSAFTGSAGLARATGEQVYDTAYAMRQSAIKELTAKGRRPLAGNGGLPLFNGEDNVNLTYRKLNSDFLNDRDNTVSRVVGPGAGVEAIGLQRPKQLLQMNISKERNYDAVLDMLDDNPYALQVTKIAQGVQVPGSGSYSGSGSRSGSYSGRPGPAEMALAAF